MLCLKGHETKVVQQGHFHETVKHIKDSHRGNDPETPQLNRDTHWSCKPPHTHRSHVASRHYSRSSIQSCALPVGHSVCWASSRNPVCRNIAFYNPSTLGASSCFTSEFRGRMCDKLQGEQVAPQCCRLEFIWLFRWADKRGRGGELGSEEGEESWLQRRVWLLAPPQRQNHLTHQGGIKRPKTISPLPITQLKGLCRIYKSMHQFSSLQ